MSRTPKQLQGAAKRERHEGTVAVIEGFLAHTPCPRVGNVGDMAAIAARLLSDDARWINGRVINVNGGALMR